MLLLLAYGAAATLGLQWASYRGAASPIWPAAGIGLAGLLLGGKKLWPAIVLGGLGAMQLTSAGHPLWSQILIALGNSAAAACAVLLIERLGRVPFRQLGSLHNLLVLIAAAGAAAVISAAAGAGALFAAGVVELAALPAILQTWFFGDFVGIVTVSALVLTSTVAGRQVWSAWRLMHLFAALAAVALLSSAVFFGSNSARAWAIYPALGYVALLFRVQGAALGVLVALVVASSATILGHGPFAPAEVPDLVLLQQYLAVTCTATLLLAATVHERDSEVRLREAADREISARRLAAEAERRLSLALQSSRTGIWDWDLATARVEWSDECYVIHGIAPGKFGGDADAFRKLVHPDDLDMLWATVTGAIDRRREYQSEFRIVRPNGEVRWVANSGRATYADDGTALRMVGTVTDISERKDTEAQLARLAERAELAQQAARSSLYEVDVATRQAIRDPYLAGLLGYAPGELNAAQKDWERRIHPDDLADYQITVAQALQRAERYAMEYRAVGKDGLVLWVGDVGRVLRDEEGTPTRMVGMASDITERKLSEQALRLRTAELESLIESAPIGLAYFDREYRYTRINDVLAGINGVAAGDHVGRTIREVLPANAPSVEPMIDQVFATAEPIGNIEVEGETPLAPGAIRHWITGFFPVVTGHGEVEAVGIWVVEISERKAAEERERLLAREVDHRAKNLLAVVQSVVQLSQAKDANALKAGVVGRIQSLARAHSLLADSRWDGVELTELAQEELAPFAIDGPERVRTDGPRLRLRPPAAQSLALVLHELATNAAKYGALSTPEGQLRLEWRTSPDGGPVEFLWQERGRATTPPKGAGGFGSRMIKASVERQLGGRVHYDWRGDGLDVRLDVPAGQFRPAERDEPVEPATESD